MIIVLPVTSFCLFRRTNVIIPYFPYFSIDMTEDSRSDILIPGSAARNRGIHGDLVAVEILPKSEWKGRSLVIHETTQGRYFKIFLGL